MAVPAGDSTSATFVLIHGTWHGGWAWDKVAVLLRGQGHHVIAPSLPGLGATSEDCVKYIGNVPAKASLTLEDGVRFLKGLIEKEELHNVVLVGHSSGCIYASQVAPLVAARLRHWMGVSGQMLEDDQAFVDILPPELVQASRREAEADPDYTAPIDWEEFRTKFCNEGSEHEAQVVFERLARDPISRWATKVHRTQAFRALPVPKHFICFNQDLTFDQDGQHYLNMAKVAGAPVLTMDGSHEAIVSRAGELTQLLLQAVFAGDAPVS